jgi:adenosylcobinamide kinase/adenosylcobinamide-phosphate guanylyltransferase
MKKIKLITGGSRSGKSFHALEAAMKYNKRGFIATAIPFDDEMKLRIDKHKAERNKKFLTLEEPYNISKAIIELENKVDVMILDCISVWIGNLLYKYGEDKNNFAELSDFYHKLNNLKCNIIIVTNEVGMGIIPENKLARHYRDLAGFTNQKIAKLADEVIFMVSGIATKIKG